MDRPLALLGHSNAIRRVRGEIEQAARADTKVLVTGESGVGKEVVARMIHDGSLRARRRFVAVNCAGFTDTLLESELFGHVRGSFTDAYRDKRGLVDLADGGTLFMDEVGEMTPRMQGSLLRFLENGEVQPVGCDSLQRSTVDVRVVAATNRCLRERVEQKEFRIDLFYRLHVIHIAIPPLRERRDDVLLLFAHFVDQFSRRQGTPPPQVSAAAERTLLEHEWPGNVRELINVAEQLVVRLPGALVTPADLPLGLAGQARPSSPAERHPRDTSRESRALADRMLRHGETFWSAVYEPFMLRDLTREQVREVVRLGLISSGGSYRTLVGQFNLEPSEYRRFLAFLRKHQCQVPFHGLRVAPAGVPLSDCA
jgi:DNA-binding NtrC family response regulator